MADAVRCATPECDRWGIDSLGGQCLGHAPRCIHSAPIGWWCRGCEAEAVGWTEHDAFRADARGTEPAPEWAEQANWRQG